MYSEITVRTFTQSRSVALMGEQWVGAGGVDESVRTKQPQINASYELPSASHKATFIH